MVRRRFHPIIAFVAVLAAAGSVTAAGLTFTAHTVARTVAELPPVKTRTLPSYVVRLPEAKAADLDISKSVEVRPALKLPVSAPTAVAATTPVSGTTAATPVVAGATATPTLVAETSPMSEEPAAAAGDLYVVKSDVFVRSGPSKRYGQVGTVTGGTQVTVSGADGGWLKVSFNGTSGWVYQRYLARADNGEVAEVETARAPF